jgi:hypothetical protein
MKELELMTTTTTTPHPTRSRTARNVLSAGIAGGAILVGMAFAIDALSNDSHLPTSEVTTHAPGFHTNEPNLVYNGE